MPRKEKAKEQCDVRIFLTCLPPILFLLPCKAPGVKAEFLFEECHAAGSFPATREGVGERCPHSSLGSVVLGEQERLLTQREGVRVPPTTFIYSKIHLEPLLLLSPFWCSMLWEPGTCKLAWRQSEEMTGEQGRADPGMRREQLELKHHLRYPVLSLHCRMLAHSYLLCASSFLCLEHYVAILQRLSQINSWLIFSEHYFLRKDFPDLLGTLSSPCPMISWTLTTPAQVLEN